MNSTDRKIRNLYDELRRQDAASAPSFRSLTAAREAAGQVLFGRLAAVGSVAVLLTVAAGWLLLTRTGPDPSAGKLAVDWSRWQSPTGFLLNYSGDSVLKGGPILDIPVRPEPQTKENEK